VAPTCCFEYICRAASRIDEAGGGVTFKYAARAGSERVVVAADDMETPIGEQLVGAAVTAQVDGSTQNLGIITGIDVARHWVVVDLIGSFLLRQNAELVLDR
jgi:hypothetical protein